jgi:hypothetical protein
LKYSRFSLQIGICLSIILFKLNIVKLSSLIPRRRSFKFNSKFA